jgi:4,5-dihydroxyphthalate decarboxylase
VILSRVSAALSATPICEEFVRIVRAQKLIELDLESIRPIHRAFKPMVVDAAFDVSELALVTAIQAVDHARPIIPLPVTVAARFQHRCIVQDARRSSHAPHDLPGRRIAVRAYSQTTGAWVRTILEREFGVSSGSIDWVTQEAPHVPDVDEPSNVLRDPDGAGPAELLATGRVDAAIFGNDLPLDPWIRPVIAEPDRVARASYARTGVVPINHIVAVGKRFAERHPDLVRYVYRALAESRSRALGDGESALHPLGIDAMRPSVEALLQSAATQDLTTRPISYEELFGEATLLLQEA